ncbi:MAG TPA: hypothetical protein VLD35_01725 [Caldimonas sp.]|nr:hypothetical protein [Caldimonas sp.]
MKRLRLCVATLAVLAGSAAPAATIYRCGNEYRDAACADGKALLVPGAATPDQQAEAREVARREKTLAAEMTRDRREQEALARPPQAGSLSAPRAVAPASAAAAKKPARKHAKKAGVDEERDFVAAVPKARKSGS